MVRARAGMPRSRFGPWLALSAGGGEVRRQDSLHTQRVSYTMGLSSHSLTIPVNPIPAQSPSSSEIMCDKCDAITLLASTLGLCFL